MYPYEISSSELSEIIIIREYKKTSVNLADDPASNHPVNYKNYINYCLWRLLKIATIPAS